MHALKAVTIHSTAFLNDSFIRRVKVIKSHKNNPPAPRRCVGYHCLSQFGFPICSKSSECHLSCHQQRPLSELCGPLVSGNLLTQPSLVLQLFHHLLWPCGLALVATSAAHSPTPSLFETHGAQRAWCSVSFLHGPWALSVLW